MDSTIIIDSTTCKMWLYEGIVKALTSLRCCKGKWPLMIKSKVLFSFLHSCFNRDCVPCVLVSSIVWALHHRSPFLSGWCLRLQKGLEALGSTLSFGHCLPSSVGAAMDQRVLVPLAPSSGTSAHPPASCMCCVSSSSVCCCPFCSCYILMEESWWPLGGWVQRYMKSFTTSFGTITQDKEKTMQPRTVLPCHF